MIYVHCPISSNIIMKQFVLNGPKKIVCCRKCLLVHINHRLPIELIFGFINKT